MAHPRMTGFSFCINAAYVMLALITGELIPPCGYPPTSGTEFPYRYIWLEATFADLLVHRDVLQKPGLAETVETASDITFQNPFWQSSLAIVMKHCSMASIVERPITERNRATKPPPR